MASVTKSYIVIPRLFLHLHLGRGPKEHFLPEMVSPNLSHALRLAGKNAMLSKPTRYVSCLPSLLWYMFGSIPPAGIKACFWRYSLGLSHLLSLRACSVGMDAVTESPRFSTP